MATDNKEVSGGTSELVIVDLASDKNLRLAVRDYVHNTGKTGLPHELYRSPNPDESRMLNLAMKAAMFDIGINKAWPKKEKDKSPFELVNLSVKVDGAQQDAYVLWSDGNLDGVEIGNCSDRLKVITALNLRLVNKSNLIPAEWVKIE